MAVGAMPVTPRAMRMRRWLRWWHRGFGLAAAVWLVLLALTGSAIAFYEDLDGWLNPDWHSIPAATLQDIDVDAALLNLQQQLPGFSARFIDLPDQPGRTLAILGSASLGGTPTTIQAFVDPRDGSVLGWRGSEGFSLHRRQLMDSLYRLHTELLLHDAGVWLIGLLALLWMVDHFAGVALALPRLAGWLSALRIGGRGFNLRRLYDLHRAPGLWLLPLTFTLALTGWCLSWYTETRALVQLAAPVTERLHLSFPDAPSSSLRGVGIDAARRSVATLVDGPIDSVVVLPRQGAYGVRSFDPRDVDDLGRLWTYVSMADGSIMGQRHDVGSGPGDTFFAWQYALHSGRAFGGIGQATISLAGIGTAVLCCSGVWLWWRRRRAAG